MEFCLSDFQELLGVAVGLNAGYAAILFVSNLSFDSVESRAFKTESYISNMLSDASINVEPILRQELSDCRARLQPELDSARELLAADKKVAGLISLAVAGALSLLLCISVLAPFSVPAAAAWIGVISIVLLPFASGLICWSRSDKHMRRAKSLADKLSKLANKLSE